MDEGGNELQIYNQKPVTSLTGELTLKWCKSSASCMLSDIKGIIFGGVSSRFWMLRVHINSIPISGIKYGDLPLYAWECITLEMKNKNVDLVIKNENDMIKLITLIIISIETKCNKKGSAPKSMKDRYWVEKSEYYQRILQKYKWMKWRSKISFTALQNKKTIQELILYQILKSYYHFVHIG